MYRSDKKMATSESQKKAVAKYQKNNVTRVSLVIDNDFYKKIDTRLQRTGESKNGFIIQAIKEKLERDEPFSNSNKNGSSD